MIASMTGYGKAVLQLDSKKITIEIKSLNSKNLDINVRMPSNYREKELEIRKEIAHKLVRGKVDFGMYIENTGIDTAVKINKELVKKYIAELKDISDQSPEHLLAIAMQLPETVSSIKEDIDPQEWESIRKTIDQAINHLVQYREEEGNALQIDFEKRIVNIENLMTQVASFDTDRKKELKGKLRKALEELQLKIDENRFEQELIYYLEKLDITEEQVRLKNHLSYYKQMLHTGESNGKKLGFITQELGREINTIGSKANYAPMQKIVVQMKDELEKIKEQTLNIL